MVRMVHIDVGWCELGYVDAKWCRMMKDDADGEKQCGLV